MTDLGQALERASEARRVSLSSPLRFARPPDLPLGPDRETASLMLRKLGSYPRQNSLAVALRELGRIERTLHTLSWVQDPEMRRRTQIGLNKGEAKNALARAVFFDPLGELRDRSFENQRYATTERRWTTSYYSIFHP